MRHRSAHRKLGRKTEHRISLLRNLAASLISHGRIRTTEAKAKELRPFVEKLVTLGKRDSLHARRHALSILPQREVVTKLFSDVSPRFSERPGGYTRILKLAHRQGDGASMAFIEFVDFKFEGTSGGAAPVKDDRSEKKKAEKEPKAKAEEAEPEEESPKAKGAAKAPRAKKPAAAKKKTAKKKAKPSASAKD
ncbi:MAG TPA: 50S ribosomal protein L17 [Vicinamibacteria bacterium]